MKYKFVILSLIICVLLLPDCAFAKPQKASKLAIITNIKGKVTVIHSSNPTKPARAGLMMELRENDTVKTGKNSKITVVYYSDGHGENYSPNSIFKILSTGGKVIKGKKPQKSKYSKRSFKIARGTPKDFRPKGESRNTVHIDRGKPVIFVNLSKVKIITLNPTIMWKKIDEAREYEIFLKDRKNGRKIWKSKTAKTEVTYPSDAPPLKYGMSYIWKIKARNGSDVIGEGTTRFDILTKDKVKDIEKIKNKLKEEISKNPKNTTPRVVLAMLYESYDLLDEAAGQYREILKIAPDSKRVQRHLNAIYAGK
ncbi:MAG: hypothetical protein K8T10_05595 [Candidatus Eremiobacteraeota bacterium]|nr:hypothetical protein [Candidatus Eremiobacteraeota bacterium]